MAKILLVTSDSKAVSGLRDAIVLHGYSLDVALSGDEALKRAANGKPDMVVLHQPPLPADVFIEHLKKNPLTAHLPALSLDFDQAVSADIIFSKIQAAMTHSKILVAEDDRQMAYILKAVLEKSGYEVKLAHDGAHALSEIKSWHPGLLILDIMLPVIDGFHLCQTMNEDPSFDPRPKVLIISGRSSEWDQNLGQACGAEDYMVKPLSHVELLSKVKTILNR